MRHLPLQDRLDQQEVKALQVRQVQLVSPVIQVLLELPLPLLDLQDHKAQRDQLDLQVQLAALDRKVFLELRVLLETRELRGLQAHKVQLVLPDLLAYKE